MTSLCTAAALAFLCALRMYALRGERPLRFPYAGVLLLFFRVFPFLIPGGGQAERVALLVLDITVFVFFCLKQWKNGKKELPAICILWLTEPNLCVNAASSSLLAWEIGMAVLLGLALALRKIRSRYPLFPTKVLLHPFGLLSLSVLAIRASSLCAEKLGEAGTGMLYLGIAGSIAALLWGALLLRHRDSIPQKEPKKQQSVQPSAPLFQPLRKDAWICLLFLLLSLPMQFWRLGTVDFPVSAYTWNTCEDDADLFLSFDDVYPISEIRILLGCKESPKVSLYSSGDEGLEEIAVSPDLGNVFKWSTCRVDMETDLLLIQALGDKPIQILEMVILDKDGNVLLPDSAENYPGLFDEQTLFQSNPGWEEASQFDEVYHARSAYEMIHRLRTYENTHPPLGKWLISLGIRLFGMVPFGWRFVGAAAGAFIAPLMYLFALRITRRRGAALCAGVLMLSDTLRYMLTRLATLDGMSGLFVLCMFYFMTAFIQDFNAKAKEGRLHRQLFLGGLFSGIAIATKWTGLYAGLGICILFLLTVIPAIREKTLQGRKLKNMVWVCVVSYVVLPCIIYVLSYIPFISFHPGDGLLKRVVDNASMMLNYHSGLHFDHPYSSEWYGWLIGYRPLLVELATDGDMCSTASMILNPVIGFAGLAALLHHIRLWIIDRDSRARNLVILWLSMLLPWLLANRTTFIYHYFPCELMLSLMLVRSLSLCVKRRRLKMIGITVLSVLMFVFLFHAISGLPIPRACVDCLLELFPWYRFV